MIFFAIKKVYEKGEVYNRHGISGYSYGMILKLIAMESLDKR